MASVVGLEFAVRQEVAEVGSTAVGYSEAADASFDTELVHHLVERGVP